MKSCTGTAASAENQTTAQPQSSSAVQRTLKLESSTTTLVKLDRTETAKLTAAIKRKATDDLFRPASAIVDEVLLEDMGSTAALPTLPKPETLARATNRCRQARRPPEPTDLEFVIDESSIPEHFLRADVETLYSPKNQQ